jgi:Chaperone of endosialidase
MLKKLLFLFNLLAFGNLSAQNVGIGTSTPAYKLTIAPASSFGFGNGNSTYSSRTETRTNAGLAGSAGAQSGMFDTDNPTPAANWYLGAMGYQHLLDVRDSDPNFNYAMQIAGSQDDQEFWVRKTAGNPAQAWSRMMTSSNLEANAILNQNALAQTTANYWISGTGRANLINSNTGYQFNAVPVIFNSSTDVYANIRVLQSNSTLNDGMYINYNSTGSTSADLRLFANGTNERMTIKANNGSVGIGTNSPSARLHINDFLTNGNLLRIETTGTEADMRYVSTNGDWQVGTDNGGNGTSSNQFYIYDNAYRLTVQKGTGNVGVGTVAPNSKLEVVGSSGDENTGGIFRINTPAGGANLRMGVVNGISSWIQSHGGLPLYINGLGNNVLLNTNGGSVGIGTFSPTQKVQINGGQLYVPGFTNQNWGNTGTFIENFLGTGDVSFQSGTFSYCIRADYGTIGDWFACYSDQRIKKGIRPFPNNEALAILNQIELKHYQYIDYINHGTKERIGVIAQEVETVFPEAISTLKNFIPNVYQLAKNFTVNEVNQSMTIATQASCDCKVGDKMRIFINKDREPRELEVIAVNRDSFTLANWQMSSEEEAPRQVFVFGKEIPDFRGVDYDRIFLLGMASIQELDRKVSELEKIKAELDAIKATIAEMKQKRSE